MSGDINQGLGDALEVVRVDGNSDGSGFPSSITIRRKGEALSPLVVYVPLTGKFTQVGTKRHHSDDETL